MIKNCGLSINKANARGSTALHWATFSGNYISTSYLLAFGADINKVDSKGFTPLHLAIQASVEDQNSRSIRLLLRRGTDISIRDI